MQKDEDDILEDWIIYHGYVFGYSNLYIIDNHSDPSGKCPQILKFYHERHGVNIYSRDDYRKKGQYICELIRQTAEGVSFSIPLDIDEFIGLDTGDTSDVGCVGDEGLVISTCRDQIRDYLGSLDRTTRHPLLSFQCYLTLVNTQPHYDRPVTDCRYYHRVDNHTLNKKFFRPQTLRDVDHGNHWAKFADRRVTSDNAINTRLVLFHLHSRGLHSLISKAKNDISGLKWIKNFDDIRGITHHITKQTAGYHNLQTYMTFKYQGPYALLHRPTEPGVCVCTALGDRLRSLPLPEFRLNSK